MCEVYLSKFLFRWMGHFASELIFFFLVELFTLITIDGTNICVLCKTTNVLPENNRII